jgi:hypothetical protein
MRLLTQASSTFVSNSLLPQGLHSSSLSTRSLTRALAAAAEQLVQQSAAQAATATQEAAAGTEPGEAGDAPGLLAAPGITQPVVYDLGQVDLVVREAAFTEAADLFAALVPKPEARVRLLRALAVLWALPPDAAVQQYEALRRPALNEGTQEIVVGRAALQRRAAGPGEDGSTADGTSGGGGGTQKGSGFRGTFAATGHALRMMERVAVALARNEPVMLVGETGTGKTTLVSQLAALTGASERVCLISVWCCTLSASTRGKHQGLGSHQQEQPVVQGHHSCAGMLVPGCVLTVKTSTHKFPCSCGLGCIFHALALPVVCLHSQVSPWCPST